MLDPENVRILKFFKSPMIDRFSPKVHPSKQSILNFFRHLIDEGKQDKLIPVSANTLSRTIDLKNLSGISKDACLLSICKTSSRGQSIPSGSLSLMSQKCRKMAEYLLKSFS
ncbi:hypothetical protein V8G54_018206 [Vigna mungo]|uniref:Uncharacterized protein n=1 Tax=Vigna mungo TaxID=3915 RepID=A0AAQ3N7R1_VIGMU